MRKKKTHRGIASFCILLILVLVMLYSGLRILESTVFFTASSPAEATPKKTVTRNGVEYFPRQDITTMLVLGIDQTGPVASSNYYRNNGAADSVMLLIFDETNAECTVLYLNRDMMLDLDVLGVRGEYAGTTFAQLALAHTYGTGLEDSCENVKNTLMNNLHGVSIDYYISMKMDTIPILNDSVGGVRVTVVDDFSQIDPSITMGEITLRGDQVLNFVRERKGVGDQKNVSRMERQKEYISGFLDALREKEAQDANFILRVYDEVAPYLVSDCPINTLSSMMDRYLDYELKEVVTPQGENLVAEGHYQFYADEEALDELLIRLFYAPK